MLTLWSFIAHRMPDTVLSDSRVLKRIISKLKMITHTSTKTTLYTTNRIYAIYVQDLPIHTAYFSPSAENEDFRIPQCKIPSFSPIKPNKQICQRLRAFCNMLSEIFVLGFNMLR